MTAVVLLMALTVLVAFVVISVFSSEEEGGSTEHRPGQPPDPDETHLGDLLDP